MGRNESGEFAAYMRRAGLRNHLFELGGGEHPKYWKHLKDATVVGPAFNLQGRKLIAQVLNWRLKYGPSIDFGAVVNHPDADITENYCQVVNLASQGKPFIWYLYAYFYAVGFRRLWSLVSPRIERCNFKGKSWRETINQCSVERPIVFKASPQVLQLRDAFLGLSHMTLGAYITLHVRRISTYGGAAKCDTSVEGVVEYVRCLITSKLPLDGKALSQPLVLFSDETNQTYLDSLLQGLSEHARTPVIHGDPLVQRIIDETLPDVQENPDNFLVYCVGKAIQFGAWRRLSRRGLLGWEDCRPCQQYWDADNDPTSGRC